MIHLFGLDAGHSSFAPAEILLANENGALNQGSWIEQSKAGFLESHGEQTGFAEADSRLCQSLFMKAPVFLIQSTEHAPNEGFVVQRDTATEARVVFLLCQKLAAVGDEIIELAGSDGIEVSRNGFQRTVPNTGKRQHLMNKAKVVRAK